MADVGDILEMTLRQLYLNDEMVNVLHYRIDAVGTGTLRTAVDTLYNDRIMPDMLPLQSAGLQHFSCDYQIIDSDVDFGAIAASTPLTGEVAGANQPNFLALSFIKNRTTRVTRDGYFRLGGLPEAVTAANVLDPAYATEAAALAETLEDVQGISGWNFTPVIYGRPTGAPNFLPARVNDISDVFIGPVTSQNSRK